MRLTHSLYALLCLVKSAVKRDLVVIDEFLIAATAFTPSPLGCCLRGLSAFPLTRLSSGNRIDQKNTKGRTANVQFGFFVLLGAVFTIMPAKAAEITVASAANFSETLQALKKPFKATTGHTLKIISGSSGTLASQIINGAPFDILFSADTARIEHLQSRDLIETKTKTVYALGHLVLWSPDKTRLKTGSLTAALAKKDYHHLAIANPALAPYGRAAMETLRALGLYFELSDRLIQGQNISQTFTLTASGAAPLGLVAKAQLFSDKLANRGSHITVPASLHQPIKQSAAVLKSARNKTAARLFMQFIKSRRATDVISTFGYSLPKAQ